MKILKFLLIIIIFISSNIGNVSCFSKSEKEKTEAIFDKEIDELLNQPVRSKNKLNNIFDSYLPQTGIQNIITDYLDGSDSYECIDSFSIQKKDNNSTHDHAWSTKIYPYGNDFISTQFNLKTIDLWKNNKKFKELTNNEIICDLYFLRDNKLLSFNFNGGGAKLWNLNNFEYEGRLDVFEVSFQLPNGNLVTFSHDLKKIVVLTLQNKKLFEFDTDKEDHENVFSKLCLFNNQIIFFNSGYKLKACNIKTGKVDIIFYSQHGLINHLLPLNNNKLAVSLGHKILILEPDFINYEYIDFDVDEDIEGMFQLQNGFLAVYGAYIMKIFDLKTNTCISNIKIFDDKCKVKDDFIYSAFESEDGRIFTCTSNGFVKIWANELYRLKQFNTEQNRKTIIDETLAEALSNLNQSKK